MKLWLIGAYGIVATTAMVGAKAIEKGVTDTTGLVSELFDLNIPLKFEFGGHDIRKSKNFYEAALEHWKLNRHFDFEVLEEVGDELKTEACKGTTLNCGSGLQELGELETIDDLELREIVDTLSKDMKDSDVVVNVASTEPLILYNPEYHKTLEGFEEMLDENKKEWVSASMLYAYSALKQGIPYANFTPSVGSNLPALKELAIEKGVPHAGNDGKTGETLVKTTLAPMFSYRNLRIMGWMGYNILGDFDGKVLSHKDNKQSKVESKDKVLEKVLGYSPYTITEIEYFPSLVDNKTAFDFIHFKGFLGTSMKMYFIWDAVDAIVAAPLVLDIARFLLLAKKKGCKGVVKELGFFFKSPMDTEVVNTHEQFEILKEWCSEIAK